MMSIHVITRGVTIYCFVFYIYIGGSFRPIKQFISLYLPTLTLSLFIGEKMQKFQFEKNSKKESDFFKFVNYM